MLQGVDRLALRNVDLKTTVQEFLPNPQSSYVVRMFATYKSQVFHQLQERIRYELLLELVKSWWRTI
jgi:hypothetical protein